MATKDGIFEYVMNNPENTNPNILRDMLGNLNNGGSTGAVELGEITIINNTNINYPCSMDSVIEDSSFGVVMGYVSIAKNEQKNCHVILQKITPASYTGKSPYLTVPDEYIIKVAGPGIQSGNLVATKTAGASNITGFEVKKISAWIWYIEANTSDSSDEPTDAKKLTITLTVA